MELKKIKGYVIGFTIGITLGITAYTNGGALTSFTGMTQSWFNAIKTKLDGTYTSGKMCTSDASGQIQCITDIPVSNLDKYGTVSYKIQGTSVNDSSLYKCLKIDVPDQCINWNSSEDSPPCEIQHTESRLGINTGLAGGSYNAAGGYSRHFRIFKWGTDGNHYTGYQRLMAGYTSNGSDWYTYTTYSATQLNRNTGFSAGGILGRDKFSSCPQDSGVSSNSNINKNQGRITLVGRRDFNTVFIIKYPLTKLSSGYNQVY